MKKQILLFVLICFSFIGYAQIIDTVFNTAIYKSYFNKEYKQPLFVSYGLYRGGGNESREGMSFKGIKNITATTADYKSSGYDKGHLVSAEDFANNLESQKITFRYYNCLPQTPNLNRGVWKTKETSIREESRSDSLFIICGGYDFKLVNKLYVPSYCFKIVRNTRTNKITHVLIFTNNLSDNTANETSLNILMQKSGYKKLEELIK